MRSRFVKSCPIKLIACIRTTSMLLVLFFVFLAACDEKPVNPIAVQGDKMIDAYQRSQKMKDETNLETIRKAVQAHRAVNDKFPQSLEEIMPLLSSPNLDLSIYTYNSSDGSVVIKK